jgi:putative ABC transport system permease protein
MNTRWIKVFRDLWSNRSRTILVILSIAMGVFAIGMITISQTALSISVAEQYADIYPADAIFLSEPNMDEDFVESIKNMRGITQAEGRRNLALRISLDGNGESWRDISLYALQDYENQKLMKVSQQGGNWPPEKGEILLERATMEFIGAEPGDTLLVKTTDGRQYKLIVSGQAHDLYRVPPIIEGWLYGYVSAETIRWMKQPADFNELYVSMDSSNLQEVKDLSEKVSKRIEGIGLPVYQKTLPDKGEHPLSFIITTVILLLGLIAILALILSVFLVINVISALITQQEKQIGMMKAIGARSGQILGIYFGMILILGFLACLIAIPASYYGAGLLVSFVAQIINFDVPTIKFTSETIFFQLAVGLLLPLIAATPVIIIGTRLSPADVLSEYGISQIWQGFGFLDSFLAVFPKMTRDFFLAIRNPFRNRTRLILSLISLTFAGAVFMSIINLSTALNASLNEMFGFWEYDAWLVTEEYIPAGRLENKAATIPGVKDYEAWGYAIGRVVREDDSESNNLYLLAPLDGSQLLNPPILEGRNLLPGETDGVLITPGLISDEPQLKLGGKMKLKVDGIEKDYNIVGIMNMMGNSTVGYFTIINYSAYSRQVRESNRSNAIVLTLDARDLPTQQNIINDVETLYDQSNIDVVSSFIISEEREEIDAAFNIIMALLMAMTIILGFVGGLGLMGTMSLNVMDRTREIGVMRAYGASSNSIFRIVIIEGLVIGLLSWLPSVLISIPISTLLSRTIGISFLDYPLSTNISPFGMLIWVGLVIVISIIASLMPANRAVRLTVTQVLAYQ